MRSALAAVMVLVLLLGPSTTVQSGEVKTIYQGPGDAAHWVLPSGKEVPAANAQEDGLNPHKSGGYCVFYKEPVKDFIFSFQYKLSPGCNSGVFLRVSDQNNPVMTGLEVALDDSQGTGMHDPGAFYDLVSISRNAQKPAGQWNDMKIEARGSKVTVTLNGVEVSTLDHDLFPEPGVRPDGSKHKFQEVAIKNLNQMGYLGFQDHGSDCWFRMVKLEVLD